MPVLPGLTHGLTAALIDNPAAPFVDTDGIILTFMWKDKGTETPKAVWKRGGGGGRPAADRETFPWCGNRGSSGGRVGPRVAGWNPEPGSGPQTRPAGFRRRRKSSLREERGDRTSAGRRTVNLKSGPFIKTSTKRTTDSSAQRKITQLLEKNTGENLQDRGLVRESLDSIPEPQFIEEKN